MFLLYFKVIMSRLFKTIGDCTLESKLVQLKMKHLGIKCLYKEGFVFRVYLGSVYGKEHFLSISVPPDANMYEDVPNVVETAIFCEDEFKCIDDWGYSDVKRFSGDENNRASNNEVVLQVYRELERLKGLF